MLRTSLLNSLLSLSPDFSGLLFSKTKGANMKTEEEIRQKLKWLINALDDPDNASDNQQTKLYAQIDLINWLGVKIC